MSVGSGRSTDGFLRFDFCRFTVIYVCNIAVIFQGQLSDYLVYIALPLYKQCSQTQYLIRKCVMSHCLSFCGQLYQLNGCSTFVFVYSPTLEYISTVKCENASFVRQCLHVQGPITLTAHLIRHEVLYLSMLFYIFTH